MDVADDDSFELDSSVIFKQEADQLSSVRNLEDALSRYGYTLDDRITRRELVIIYTKIKTEMEAEIFNLANSGAYAEAKEMRLRLTNLRAEFDNLQLSGVENTRKSQKEYFEKASTQLVANVEQEQDKALNELNQFFDQQKAQHDSNQDDLLVNNEQLKPSPSLLLLAQGDKIPFQSVHKKQFRFPQYLASICVYVALSVVADSLGILSAWGSHSHSHSSDLYKANIGISLAVYTLIFLFTFLQFLVYIQILVKVANLILKSVFFSKLEDIILLLISFNHGFRALSMAVLHLCLSPGVTYSVEDCTGVDIKDYFPIQSIAFGFISLILLPLYFKSISRHAIFISWGILTAFVIATLVVGDYETLPEVVLTIVLYLVSIYEIERTKMVSYFAVKEAEGVKEKNNQTQINLDKSEIIHRKLNAALVHQILPPKVADAIRRGQAVEPESFEEVTIFFSDVVGFTSICAQVTPIEVVQMLNELYTVMDYCTSLFPLYKVETIGDAYMLVGGLPVRDANHALQIADFALLVQRAVQAVKSPVDGSSINIRIGIHSGPVMAGVVGNLMPRYCLFGDTVNTASRMESNGLPGKIHCSGKTAQILLKSGRHELSERGPIDVKGKGIMYTYWLDSAVEENENSNALAIEKTELMVQEILSSTFEDSNHQFPMSPSRAGSKFDSNKSGPRTLSPLPPLSPIPSSSGARHSIKFNRAHNNIVMSPSERSGSEEISAGAKVLVVEDSAAQRKMLVMRLRKANSSWDISTANNGEEALQKLKAAKFNFDIAFVDENLSINDGLFGHELVQVMRKSFQMRNCVIIACTSNPDRVGPALRAAGVDIIWPKPPPTPDEIKMKINSLIYEKLKYSRDDEAMNSSSKSFLSTGLGF